MTSSTVGVVLCVGVTIFMFAAFLVPVLSWCNGKLIACSEGSARAAGQRSGDIYQERQPDGGWKECVRDRTGETSFATLYFCRSILTPVLRGAA